MGGFVSARGGGLTAEHVDFICALMAAASPKFMRVEVEPNRIGYFKTFDGRVIAELKTGVPGRIQWEVRGIGSGLRKTGHQKLLEAVPEILAAVVLIRTTMIARDLL